MNALILEAPWFGINSLRLPTLPTKLAPRGRLVTINRLDMRLEDLRSYGGTRIVDVYNWVARLPNSNKYLTYEHGLVDEPQARDLLSRPRAWQLPPEWWHYVLGTMGDEIVKAPKYPRREAGEPSQEEVDARQPSLSGQPVTAIEHRLQAVLVKPF